jgi:hypothetical protein
MASLIYGVSAGDVTTFAVITHLMGAITLVACYAPTRKAMSVDPIIAPRCEPSAHESEPHFQGHWPGWSDTRN